MFSRPGLAAAMGLMLPATVMIAPGVVATPPTDTPAPVVPALAAVAPARPITGRLDKPGYTIVAVAADGKARTAYAADGRFSLRPPTGRVTLHLRGTDGVYAGPVVLRALKRGKRAVVGVRAGARLGPIRVRAKRGYAVLAHKSRKSIEYPRWWARAKHGVPVGANTFGHVRSRAASSARGRDTDLDSVPDLLDIDDDGDLVLDKFDRVSSAQIVEVTDEFLFQSNLTAYLDQTVNAGAGTLSRSAVDAGLQSLGRLQMNILPGTSQELDCGQLQDRTGLAGLPYCTAGGTGHLFEPGVAQQRRFPDDFDLDRDGMGAMVPGPEGPAPGSGNLVMTLQHGARSDQIGTGDLLIQRVVRDGVETQFPAVVQYVYATTPALASYDDGHGNAATITYPAAPGGPGTRGNAYPVTADGSGQVMVRLEFWRPQRASIPPEPGEWTDIGGLNYMVSGGERAERCPASAFTGLSANLRALTAQEVSPFDYAGVKDTGGDQPPNQAYRLGFTLNLTSCLQAAGLPFDVGDAQIFTVSGQTPNGPDSASQGIAFVRTG